MSNARLARIAGWLYLLQIALGIIALMAAKKVGPDVVRILIVIAALEYGIVVLLLGKLFQRANSRLSVGVALVGLAGCAVSALIELRVIAPGFNPLAIFGLYCFGLGMLVVRTGCIPRWVGFWLILGGASWLTFAIPVFSKTLAPWNMALGASSEIIFTLYLIIFGVRTGRAQ